MIFDGLRARGWSVGTFSFVRQGHVLWSADASKDDGKRIVVQAEVLAAALLELEAQCQQVETCSQPCRS